MSISMRSVVSRSKKALYERLRFVVEEESAVKQIDADDADRLLLQGGLDVEHTDVQDDLARIVAGVGLELEPHPAVALVVPFEAARDDGICESEEGARVAALVAEPFEVQLVFVIEHRLQTTGGDVPIDLALDGATDRHVVGRNGLGYRPCGSAYPEEPTRDSRPAPISATVPYYRGSRLMRSAF
jgi:hypothetical protein